MLHGLEACYRPVHTGVFLKKIAFAFRFATQTVDIIYTTDRTCDLDDRARNFCQEVKQCIL